MARFKLINLPVEIYREGENFIAYSPALRISTYAKTIEKVKSRFSDLADIFFEELSEKGTTEDVLLECGWHKVSRIKSWVPPTPVAKIEEEVKIPYPA